MASFDLFIGIDWSGATGNCHKGIQVAVAALGRSCPEIIPPPQNKGWARGDVIAYLERLKKNGHRILAGIDFAFAHPFHDHGAYYPVSGLNLKSASDLWQKIDEVNEDQPYLYGGGVWSDDVLRHYYNAPKRKDGSGGKGQHFHSRRRLTETMGAAQGRSPSPTFNCVGPAGVGTGSLAGMRMLNQIKDRAWIWPFTAQKQITALKHQADQGDGLLALVEIFPSFYFSMAGIKDREKADQPLISLNKALDYFHTDPADGIDQHVPDHDDMDAVISAAALRYLHDPEVIYPLPQDVADIPSLEGWIFGVGSPKT